MRPRIAGTPITSKNEPLAKRPAATSASPPFARSKRVSEKAAAPSKSSCCRSRTSSQIGFVHEPPSRRTRRDGIAHRQRAQDQAVHEREDRGVGADAEGQETRSPPAAKAGLRRRTRTPYDEVLAEVLEEARAPRVAARLLHLLDARRARSARAGAPPPRRAPPARSRRLRARRGRAARRRAGPRAGGDGGAGPGSPSRPPSRVARMSRPPRTSRRHSSSSTPRWVRPFPVRR